MLLAIDVGNSHTVFGVFLGKRIIYRLRVATDITRTADGWGLLLDSFAGNRKFKLNAITSAIMASVVPNISPVLEEAVQAYVGKKMLVLTPDKDLGLTIAYDNPREVGADRIANAVASLAKYKTPNIVVDLGTATAFDVISKKGEYLGGAIMPGVETSFYGLSQKAALLPRVDLHMPKKVIGTTTRKSMQAGIMFGTIDQITGILDRIEKEMKAKCTVVLTGGLAGLFGPAFKGRATVDIDLTLRGLQIIHDNLGKKE